VAELCRVADRLVILDYPSALSAAALQAAARRVLHLFGFGTEPYRVFTGRAIARELERGGFRVRDVHRLFVLPIAFHKAIGSRRVTDWLEGALARLGRLRRQVFGMGETAHAEASADVLGHHAEFLAGNTGDIGQLEQPRVLVETVA
jgi:hypothetical protein